MKEPIMKRMRHVLQALGFSAVVSKQDKTILEVSVKDSKPPFVSKKIDTTGNFVLKEVFLEKPTVEEPHPEIVELQKKYVPGRDLLVTDLDTLKDLIRKDKTQWLDSVKEQILSSTIIIKDLGRIAVVKCS